MLISKLRSNEKFKKVLYWAVIILFAGYIFAVPSFGGREKYNLIVYALLSILAIAVIVYVFLYKKFTFQPALIFIPLFVLYSFIGTAVFSKDFRGWFTIALLGVSFFVCFYSYHVIHDKRLIMNLIALGIFLFSLYFIYHYRNEILHYSSINPENSRIGTYFDNQNGVAACCLVGISISLYLLFNTRGWIKLVYLLPIITIVVVGFVTQSRSFVFGFAVVLILMLFLRMYHHKLLFVLLLALLVAAFFILINLPFLAALKVRLEDMINTFFSDSSKIDYSSVSRTIWLDYGFYLGSKNIILGYGYGGFSIYSGVGTFTHSNISEVFCDFGLPGTFIFYLPYLILPFIAIKKKLKNITFVLPVLILYVVVSFSMVFFYDKLYYVMLSLLFFLSFENKYEFNKEEYIYKNKIYNNVLVVVNSDDYQCKEVENIYNCFKANNVSSITTLVYGSAEDSTNIYISKKTNSIAKIFEIKSFIKKYKINTVVSIGNKNSIISYYSLVSRNVKQIPILLDSTKDNLLSRMLYARQSAILYNEHGSNTKNVINIYSVNNLQNGIDSVLERKAFYENSFNWK